MGKLQGEPNQNLLYVRDMLEQLLTIVPNDAGPVLPYLIDMARLEASDLVLHVDPDSSDTRPPE
ncbi:hypothetical protein [Aureimonas leprariae]|uniref:Uncharacterized protein n=1 Tax=Plantimonas leprariae TaxID=2615207 RepID=A0A7V7U1D8_9HYPH|nr:hypothetical protein [Aureimonas leprariae]KAB0681842.1 hypothetical protein F6X38_03195 [Aureimonas leprariae]